MSAKTRYSNFIIARKEKLTDKQKEIILDYVVNQLFGEKVVSRKEDIAKYVADTHFEEDNAYYTEKYNKLLEQGNAIYEGTLVYEGDRKFTDFIANLWSDLESGDNTSFEQII